MSAQITFDPVRVETGSTDCEGRLAYRDGCLIGVLTLLDPDLHGELGLGRRWYLEAGFGWFAGVPHPPTFPSLDEAGTWLRDRTDGLALRGVAALPEVTPRCAAAGHSPSACWSGTGPAPLR